MARRIEQLNALVGFRTDGMRPQMIKRKIEEEKKKKKNAKRTQRQKERESDLNTTQIVLPHTQIGDMPQFKVLENGAIDFD